ncbi:hypothetical protein ABEB36_003314 [Hypothenemus hampei]|uniref:Thyroglobulin type-1 domain-containing protein n=1 Tax=Hypothenemus hampei TaxID=57062 RepID=A0ABD1F8R5_HYPHA
MIKLLKYFFSALSFYVVYGQSQCPSVLITNFSQDNCTSFSASNSNNESFYYDLGVTENCIPRCKKYSSELPKNCSLDMKCVLGYSCQKTCGSNGDSCLSNDDCLPEEECDFNCVPENKRSCMAYHINRDSYRDTYWTAKFKPSCSNDGSWQAKQCKGGLYGRCMCFDPSGKRIFGEAPFSEASSMTCACSRRKAELETKNKIVTLHCDAQGNFEPLQCDKVSKQCWCVEPATGDPTSTVVPEKAIESLPCFSVHTFGTQYLRQCESKDFAQQMIRKKLNNHGVIHVIEEFFMCDFDGSYGRFTIEGENVYCTWRNSSKIGSYQGSSQFGYGDFNCNCARDFLKYGHNHVCLSSGNYKPLQTDGTVWYCVDEDGFTKSNYDQKPDDIEDSYCLKYY